MPNHTYHKGDKNYLFDEGKQGQAAYQFDFEGDFCFLSIGHSPTSGAEGNPNWQHVKFDMSDLIAAYTNLKVNFLNKVQAKAPQAFAYWEDVFQA